MLGGRATLLAMPRKAWQEFLVAAAGPAVSLLLALVGVFVPILSTVGPLARSSPVGVFLFYQVGMLNAVLFIFNLLPAFPMDGGRILRAFLQQFFMSRLKATWVASRIGRFIAVLLALSVIFSFLTDKWHGFMFIRLLIAYYIFRAADQEYRQVLYESQGENIFGNFRSPNEDEAVVSPPPYGSKREWRDVHRM